MISAEQAARIAAGEITTDPHREDFERWPNGGVWHPVLVHDLGRQPSYWLVPYRALDRIVGFVRIHTEGRVLAVGTFGAARRALERCPRVVTGITATEARRTLEVAAALAPAESAATPLFVHDGPPGREAWLIETRVDGAPHQWFFVTSAGFYHRPAGAVRPEELEG